MSVEQIVCTVSIVPIIAQAFIEGQAVDSGMSLSLLIRIVRDCLQAAYPGYHVTVGCHDSPMAKLHVHSPQEDKIVRRRVRDIFANVVQRENWLVSL